MTVINLQASLL